MLFPRGAPSQGSIRLIFEPCTPTPPHQPLLVEEDRVDAHDARARLRSLYASFTEGFDTKDLKDAQALLKE